eukprot:5514028-Amphidinium_carterae.1
MYNKSGAKPCCLVEGCRRHPHLAQAEQQNGSAGVSDTCCKRMKQDIFRAGKSTGKHCKAARAVSHTDLQVPGWATH